MGDARGARSRTQPLAHPPACAGPRSAWRPWGGWGGENADFGVKKDEFGVKEMDLGGKKMDLGLLG